MPAKRPRAAQSPAKRSSKKKTKEAAKKKAPRKPEFLEVGEQLMGVGNRAQVQHAKLANAREVERKKAYWSTQLEQLKELLES